MPTNFFTFKKIIILIISIFLICALGVVILSKFGILTSIIGWINTKTYTMSPVIYTDQKYNFKITYPSNKFIFSTQKATFYIFDEIKKEMNVAEVEKNFPFTLAFSPVTIGLEKYSLIVNPIDLYISVIEPSKNINDYAESQKAGCIENYKTNSSVVCNLESASAENGRPVYILKARLNNNAGNVIEDIYFPYDNYVLKFNFTYSEAGLQGGNPDAILRQKIISYILFHSFKISIN